MRFAESHDKLRGEPKSRNCGGEHRHTFDIDFDSLAFRSVERKTREFTVHDSHQRYSLTPLCHQFCPNLVRLRMKFQRIDLQRRYAPYPLKLGHFQEALDFSKPLAVIMQGSASDLKEFLALDFVGISKVICETPGLLRILVDSKNQIVGLEKGPEKVISNFSMLSQLVELLDR